MRAKKIYYLQTPANTYVLRHDLYNVGTRWDAANRQWWAPRKAAVRRALEVVGQGKVIEAVTTNPPSWPKTFRGGRPRAERKDKGKAKRGRRQQAIQVMADSNGQSDHVPVFVEPFTRVTRVKDRRQADAVVPPHLNLRKLGERRQWEKRPAAVLVVPVAGELQKVG